jgi:hypothetical protein
MHPMTRFFNWGKRREIAVALARDHIGFRDLTAWYPDWIYEIMETDEVRNTPYRQSIEETVAGKVVLELGTGRKALWAICCARAGASRVYAIEANEKSYRASVECVRSLGIANVHIIQGFSDQVDLPERCDVLVHDLIGDIGSSEGVVPFVADVKRRLLKPDAIHIPWRCTTNIVLAEDPTLHLAERTLGYCMRGFEAYKELKFVRFFSFPRSAALTAPAVFEDLKFTETLDFETSRRITVTVERDGELRGVHFYIRLHFAGDRTIDTRAGQTSWATPFVRFDAATPVREGDTLEVVVETELSANPSYAISVARNESGRMMQIGRYGWSGD